MNEDFDAAEKDVDVLDGKEEVPTKEEEVNREPEGKTDEEEVREEDEDDEEKLLEEKDEKQTDEEESKEETEEDIPEGRVPFKEITAKYPEIFKEFPSLRGVIARGNQYDEIFGSVKDAQNAVENLQAFDSFGKKILEGDSKFLLSQIGEQSVESFEKFSTSFLGSVRELHPQTYVKIVTPLIKGLLRSTQTSDNDQVKLAGRWIQKFLQLKSLEDDTTTTPEIERKEQELRAKEADLERGHASTFIHDTMGEARDRLRTIIARDFDPEKTMSPKVREAAIKEVIEQADELAGRDQRHLNTMNSLWRQAKQSGMNRGAREALVRAYLARVKTLLPGVRQKVYEDYSGPRRVRKTEGEGQEERKPKHKTHLPSSGSQGAGKSKKLDLSKVDYKKMSDLDILDAE